MDSPKTILLLFGQQENVRMLKVFLSPKYKVEVYNRETDLQDNSISLVIVEGLMLSKHSDMLQKLKQEQHPIVLPVLLVTTRKDAGLATSYLWKSIDEMIFLPVQKTELLARIEILLRLRQQSIDAGNLRNDLYNLEKDRKALQKSERRFRIIFENSLAVMLLIDPETYRVMAANKAAEAFYGWKRSQLEKMKISDFNILSAAELKAEMEKVRTSERIYFRFKHRLASGDVRDVEVYSGKVEIDGKDYLHSIIHDVSEQLSAENKLRESEDRYRLISENSTDWIYLTDTEGNFLYISPSCEKITGFAPADFISDPQLLNNIIHPEDLQTTIHHHNNTTKDQEPDEMEFRIINRKKQVSWIRHKCKPIFTDDGKYTGRRGTNQDISEEKKTKEKLRRSEEKFRMVFESANVGKSITLPSGEISVNQAFCDMLGYSQQELQNKKWQEITPAEDVPEIEQKLRLVLVGETDSIRFEKRYVHKSGIYIWADVSTRLMRTLNSKPLYFITTIVDISKKKNAEFGLTKNLNLLNNLAAQVPGVVYQYRLYPDGSSAFPYSSPGMWDIYEVTPEEVREDASPVFTRIHPDDYDYIVETITESARNQTDYESDFRVILPKQGLRWRHSNARPELLEDGSTLWHGIITDVTERKQAEEAREKSEEQYRTLFETMTQGVVHQNAAGEIISANPAAEKILGLSIDQMKGRKSIDPRWKAVDQNKNTLPGEEHPAILALQTGKEVKDFTQGIFNPQKNDYVWILVNSIPQFHKGEKKPYQVFSTFLDITDRKKAEEALSHSHDLMKYIIEHNQSAVAVHDLDLKYLFVSQRYLTEYKVKEKNVIGKHHYEVFPDIPEKWRKVHQKALKGIVSRADEDKFFRKDGSFDWTRWECRPWYQADGSIGGIIVYTEVINEQKRKEEEITKLNQRLEILIESIQQLSAAQSLEKVKEIVAKSARKLIGADGATLVFRENDHCFYVNEDAIQPLWKGKKFPMHSCISGWVMQHKKLVVIEDIFLDNRIPLDVYSPTFVKSLAMVPINISEPIGAIGNYWKEKYTPTETELQLLQTLADATARAIENITLYAELEERVKRRTEQLQAVNKELETFTYSVSHDLKAPLRGIDGYSKLLLDDYGDSLNEEATHFIQTIRNSTLQMNQLIEDLLSYSRLERSEMKNGRIAVKRFMQNLLVNYQEQTNKGGFNIQLDVPDIEIITTSIGLSIVIRNLLENAIKFTAGQPNPKIEIGLKENPATWIISIKDNGVGFDMKYHERIFEIFQRLHRAEDFPGTGIGLAMVAKALQRMGGKVWAESEPHKGSTFFIAIPKTKIQ